MLTTAELAVLDALSSGRTATLPALAATTGYSRDHLYRVLDDLVAAGLLTETRGPRNDRRVRVTDHPVVEAYRQLRSRLGHVAWPEVLSPATLRGCWYLDEPRRLSTIADRLGVSRQAVHAALAPLKDRAMLSPSGPRYALAPDIEPLLSFARAVVAHDHRQRVRSVAPSATLEWCEPTRALVRSHDPDDTDGLRAAGKWHVTGLARFHEYDLAVYGADEPAFWYGDNPPTPAEVVCHTLVVQADVRRVGYALLFIETAGVDQDTLASTAQWYDLEAVVPTLYRALDGDFERGADDPVPLPSEQEYATLKAQYSPAL